MKNSNRISFILVILAMHFGVLAGVANPMLAATSAAHFLLVYSNDVRAELEPCG